VKLKRGRRRPPDPPHSAGGGGQAGGVRPGSSPAPSDAPPAVPCSPQGLIRGRERTAGRCPSRSEQSRETPLWLTCSAPSEQQAPKLRAAKEARSGARARERPAGRAASFCVAPSPGCYGMFRSQSALANVHGTFAGRFRQLRERPHSGGPLSASRLDIARRNIVWLFGLPGPYLNHISIVLEVQRRAAPASASFNHSPLAPRLLPTCGSLQPAI